jgi:hypothetical protein
MDTKQSHIEPQHALHRETREGWICYILTRLITGRFAFAREVLVIAGAYFAYMFTRKLVFQDTAQDIAFLHAEKLIAFQIKVFTLWEPLVQAWLFDNARWFLYVLNWTYIFTFWPVIGVTAIFLFHSNRKRYKFYRNVVLLTFVVALAIFMIYPLAPPRMMPQYGFIDSIEQLGPGFYASRSAQAYYNAFAAMPSLHFGWTLLFGIMFWRTGPVWLKALGVIYPTATFIAIVGTGNHYALDALGGGVMVLAAVLIYQSIVYKWRRLHEQI